MIKHIDVVPKWVRILTGILALLNIFYAAQCYTDMSQLFFDGAGLDFTNALLKDASYEFAARNLAIGLGLGIVALRGIPESITIVTIIRALVEVQTIIIAAVTGNLRLDANMIVAVAFLAVELLLIINLIGIIKTRDAN